MIPGRLIELYGMLETGFHTFTRLTDDPEAVVGTIGRRSRFSTISHSPRLGKSSARSSPAKSWTVGRHWQEVTV
jgi:hypothetical protein